MVGIAGGAPTSKNDIRLGDVVVSQPGNAQGGVYQYDFGKNIQDEPFLNTRFLAPPPRIFLTAISALKSQYEVDGHRFQEDIETILATRKRLRKKYGRPSQATDRLFKPDVVYTEDRKCCSDIQDVKEALLVSRSDRGEDEDDPAIHYGLIASGNLLVKDAHFRDTLAKEKDILCFEMKAGGLMNPFPCLVIRGICDYSDSHKNKDWQGYAAMTAAAYAKDLLQQISPTKVEDEKRLAEVIAGVDEGVKKLVGAQQDQQHKAGLDWLTPEWLVGINQTLFCPGIPGAGKTVLTSIVVNHLQSAFNHPKIGIAYIYFNYKRRDEQKVVNVLESFIKQLTRSQPSVPQAVQRLYQQYMAKDARPFEEELYEVLQAVISLYSKVYFAFDALDECEGRQRTAILSQISQLQKITGVYIFATSRFIYEVQARFKGVLTQEIRAAPEDITRYISAHISELPSCAQTSPQLQEDIKTSISEAVDGMVLLAQIYIRSLDDKVTPNHIRDALRGFRKYDTGSAEEEKVQVLSEAYSRAMERIDGQREGLKTLARHAILWVTCAERRITTTELRHALAVRTGTLEFDQDDLPQTQDIVSVCAGLVTIDEESDIIRLVHYTTEEYFRHSLGQWFFQSQSQITATCVTYLSYKEFESGACSDTELLQARLKAYPFYDYACRNWVRHAREVDPKTRNIVSLLASVAKVESLCQVMEAPKRDSTGRHFDPATTGLHLAARFGFDEAIVDLLYYEHIDINSVDGRGRTALYLASEEGHTLAVQQLLNSGADFHTVAQDNRTPLQQAVRNGHEAVAQLLLDQGADTEATGRHGDTPLQDATQNGYRGIVDLLLDWKANINTADINGSTPLNRAVYNGNEVIIQLLLARGADIDIADIDGYTPLHNAIRSGHEAISLSLVASGASVNTADIHGITPLHEAVWGGYSAIIRSLLKGGANIDAVDKTRNCTPLHNAVRSENTAVARLLLDWGASIDAPDVFGNTPLHQAAQYGREAVIPLLLDRGANFGTNNMDGRTALQVGVLYRRKEVVWLLLDRGAPGGRQAALQWLFFDDTDTMNKN